MRTTRLLAQVLALGLTLAACIPAGPGGSGTGGSSGGDGRAGRGGLPVLSATAALVRFDACDDLLDYVVEHGVDLVGPWGLPGSPGGWGGPMVADDMAVAEQALPATGEAGRSSAQAAPVPEEGVDYSGTNVQEAGIDEPDVVKTDGRVLYAVRGDRVEIVDVASAQPVPLARIRLDDQWGSELLLVGDRLLVLGGAEHVGPHPLEPSSRPFAGGSPTARLTLFDVSDPSAPERLEQLEVDGRVLSARLSDGTVRVALRAEPNGLPFVTPEGSGLRAERDAVEANREVIRSSSPDNWIPYAVHTDAAGRVDEGPAVSCDRVHRPPEFSGLGSVAVLTLDPASGLSPTDTTSVLAGGEIVYASTDRFYVATTRWPVVPWTPRGAEETIPEAEQVTTTELHAFDATDPGATRYVASGQVDGHLLNQWSLSEHDGFLRVATTEQAPWSAPVERGAARSESAVRVLAERDGELVEVGHVGGLGLDERIYAVRFMGEVAYVVTFREIDPLYTIDLSDPTDPVARGELKIMGYSSYLHPIGEDLLLGVGQDATEQGRTLGTQVSVFDVSDLDDPTRLHQLTLEEASSEAEYDHRAFLHWPATGLVVLPFQRWSWDEASGREDIDNGALGFVADRGGIAEVGRVSHLPQVVPAGPEDPRFWDIAWRGQVRRALVVGDRLLTVSDLGVHAADLHSLTTRGWMAFGS